MAIALDTIRQSEHYRLRGTYYKVLALGVGLAIIVHVLAAIFTPPYKPRPYQLREQVFETIEIPDEIVIPPPPAEVERPELPQEAEISEEADIEETMAPTTYDPFAPPVVPQAPVEEEAEVFVAFDTAPVPVHTVQPQYPELARQAQAAGTVNVLVTIDETGRVVDAVVQASNTIPALDAAAVAAAKQWLFKPAKQREKPVKVRIIIPFNFKLD
jgi:protein TonB